MIEPARAPGHGAAGLAPAGDGGGEEPGFHRREFPEALGNVGVLVDRPAVLYGSGMDDPGRIGVEEARNQLPALLEAAEKGRSTVIMRHGRAVAALVPISAYGGAPFQQSLVPVAGTGRGLWSRDRRQRIGTLRDEWCR